MESVYDRNLKRWKISEKEVFPYKINQETEVGFTIENDYSIKKRQYKHSNKYLLKSVDLRKLLAGRIVDLVNWEFKENGLVLSPKTKVDFELWHSPYLWKIGD